MVFAYIRLVRSGQHRRYRPLGEGQHEPRIEVRLDTYPYNREAVFPPPGPKQESFELFKLETGNEHYRTRVLTWISLAMLLIGYPAMSLLGGGEDPTKLLSKMDSFMLMVLLVGTIIIEWFIFAILYGSVSVEQTGLRGIGLKKLRKVDFLWGVSFFLAAYAILAGLAWILGQLGMPLPGEISLLIPKDTAGQILWVFVAATAGFCEEVMFRGYLMTRLRLVGKLGNWVVPTIISALAFGACHAYQGMPGFILISVYGVLFSFLYIRTGSLWPCIIAHFIQDFGALFVPR